MKKNFIGILFIIVSLNKYAFSTGIIMPYFTYTHLYGNTYRINMYNYFNCDFYGISSLVSAYAYHDTCNFQSKTPRLAKRKDTLPDGRPQKSNAYLSYCENTMTMCDSPFNGTGLPAFRDLMYIDTITLPENCGMWKFSLGAISQGNWRDPAMTNVTPMSYTYYGEAILNADSTNPNSSALWQRPFVQYACANQATQWYMPAYDSDGDSLVYSQVMPRERDLKFPDPLDTLIQDIQYKAPYTLNEPFATGGTWKFNANIPSVQFTADTGQIAVMTFRIDEYRNGVFMGATFRDNLIITVPCSYTVPKKQIDIANCQNIQFSTTDTITINTNQAMQLCTYYYSNLPNANLRIYTNANQTLPLGANYSQNYISNDSIYTCIQWTPSSSDTGIYFLHTMLEDTACQGAEPIIPQDYFQILKVKYYVADGVVEYTNENGLVLYPNPAAAHSSVHIQTSLNKNITKVEWYDLQGKKVWNENLQNATISVPSIAQGLYIIKSHFEDGSVVFTKFRISQ